ncbi:UNVERIFIED_CONTAM: hypothetical protein HDU68_010213, partial [Siphonaria sp. JEL0065]
PQEATNPNNLTLSTTQSTAVIDNPSEFWSKINTMFLRLLVALRREPTSVTDWDWVHDCVTAWSIPLRWFGIVDYELGFAVQDILRAVEVGRAALMFAPQHNLEQQLRYHQHLYNQQQQQQH